MLWYREKERERSLTCRKTLTASLSKHKSWFPGRGWGQQLFSFQSPAVQWMARTSSLNCLSCRNPYQTPDSLNCLPPFHRKPLFFCTEKCFVASPSQKSALIGEILCESGRWIDVLKKRGRVLKKRGRVLKKRRLVRGTGGGPLLQKGGGVAS